MVEIRISPRAEADEWVRSLHLTKPNMALAVLLAGDRWSCVEEVALATVDGEVAGIATIAPDGEQMSGEPTIVAVYVCHEYRGRGIGYQLLEATIDHMSSKGLEPIRVDVMNSKALRMISRLPNEKRRKLSVVNQTMGGEMNAILEM